MASCLTTLRCILPLPVLAQGAGIALALLWCCCSRLLPSAQLPAISANGSGNVSLGHPHFLGQIVFISWLHVEDSTWNTEGTLQSDYGGGHKLPSSTYLLSIAASYHRHNFVQHAPFCTFYSVCAVYSNYKTLPKAWSKGLGKTPHLGLWITWKGKSPSLQYSRAEGDHLIPCVAVAFSLADTLRSQNWLLELEIQKVKLLNQQISWVKKWT